MIKLPEAMIFFQTNTAETCPSRLLLLAVFMLEFPVIIILRLYNRHIFMAITFHPSPGQILVCDFSTGFKEPEMVKNNRPVIVLTPGYKGRSGLVTVVPLSTKEPTGIMPYHYKLPRTCMPQVGRFQENDSWVKADLIYTVGFHRLNLIRLGNRDPNTGKRLCYQRRLSRERMKEIYTCVLHGLNLGSLSQHL